ncbi:hypothetical protein EsHS_00002230 [Epichloe bromicola]
MPPKRKRPEDRVSLTRRATRQTPVIPPLPPTSVAKVAQQAPCHPAVAGPNGASASASAVAPRASQPQPTQPTTETPASTAGLPPAPDSAATGPASSQTPVPIPTPPGLPAARHREGPQTAVPPRQVPSAPVQSPVPVPSMSGVAIKENIRPSDLVAPEITYHVPQSPLPGRIQSSLLRPHGPSAMPPRLDRRPVPPVVTPVLPPKPPTLAVNDRGPPRADRNIDKVVLGDLCFRTWYPSYYGKEVLGDASGNARNGGGSKEGGQDTSVKHSKKDKDTTQPMLERLYVCPSCFKYAKELVAWRGHVRICERRGFVPGRKIYTHPRGRRKVLVAYRGKGPGPKRRRGDGGVRYTEEIVQDEGEWSIWEVDGEKDGLFCQNLSLFAKLFLDNKSVFFDVTGFNYFLLVYTPPPKLVAPGTEPVQSHPPQVTGFFSKEKMSWDNNNLACILVFPPWQRKGLGALLMGASYEISRREGILGGPEKPISDLGKKGYKRFWSGEISRWLLGLDATAHQAHPLPLPLPQPQQLQQQGQQLQMPSQPGETAPTQELVVDVNDCSQGTWIAVEDCLSVLRDMGVVEDAGMGYGKPKKMDDAEESEAGDGQGPDTPDMTGLRQDAASKSAEDKKPSEAAPMKLVPRVRVDKEAVRRYVATHRISLERTCDPSGFAEGYAIKAADDDGDTNDGAKQAVDSA